MKTHKTDENSSLFDNCTIPLGIVLQDLGRIGVEWTGSKGLEEMQLWLF